MPLSPRTLRPSSTFSPKSISGLALWLDGSDANSLYTTDAGAVTAVSAPTDISGCALWLDGADSSAASMILNGSLVETWKDKSGNGRDISATGGDRPTLTSNYYGSSSALTFSGSNVMTRSASGLPFGPCTSFVVFDEAAAVNYAGLLVGSPSTGNDYDQDSGFTVTAHEGTGLNVLRCGWKVNFAAGTALVSDSEVLTSSALGKRLAAFTVGSSTAQCYMSGLISGAADAAHTASGVSNGIIVGGRYISGAVSAAYRFNGKICEIIHFNTALSDSARARVESYLAAKWGISGVHVPATAASDPVGYWGDKSGNGRHATQSTAANRPTIGAIASARGLVFDSTDSLLSTASMSDLIGSAASSPALTIAFIATNASGTAGFSLGSDNATNGRLFVSNSFDGAGTSYFDVAGTAGGRLSYSLPSSSQTAASVYVLQRSGSSMIVRRNAATIASKSDASQTFSATSAKLSIGQAIGLTGFSGTCGSVLCYPSALTASQYQRLERFLATRWNITLAPQVSNADAQNWIDRVYANGGTVTSATASAVNTFCDSITNASLRDRFYRLNLFCGSNLNAALVPLYRGPSLGGTQYGGTTDTNNAFVGVGTDYAETGASGGLLGNGSTKWLNTGFVAASSGLTSNQNIHLGVSVAPYTHPATSLYVAASMIRATPDPNNDRYRIIFLSNTTPTTDAVADLSQASQTATKQVAATNGASVPGGLWLASRTAAADLRFYNGATEQASNLNAVGSFAPLSTSLSIFATWNGSTASNLAAIRLRGYSVGLGLSASQVSAFNSALAAFESTMGRT